MKTTKSWAAGLALAFALSSCGLGSGQDDESGAGLPNSFNSKIQVYSARENGIKIVPHGLAGQLISCTLVSLSNGDSQDLSSDDCLGFLQTAEMGGVQACQVLIGSTDVVAADPMACAATVVTGEANSDADGSSKRAALNAQTVLAYYAEHHHRFGLDNRNSDIVSVVHIAENYPNAFYDPDNNVMMYGDGDGKKLRDLTYALDVAGHEMTHGVVQFTAKFLNMDEPGAVNEATADFFGEVIEGAGDWRMGLKADLEGQGLRNLADPGSIQGTIFDVEGNPIHRPYPSNVSDKAMPPADEPCSADNDDCYIHFNSTIISHALYLVQQKISVEKAEKLYYLTLTQFLTPSTTFQNVADSTMLACHQLYDPGTCQQVSEAFTAVGLSPR